MTAPQPTLPDEVAKRPLHFFWIVDWSGSMAGRKIATLNQAIREVLPDIQKITANHPEVQVWMRAIKFSDTAEWHVGPQAVELEKFVWSELATAGRTGTAQAIRLLAGELDIEKMPPRGFPPVCILISDGCCTDTDEVYDKALAELDALPWGRRAVRLAIAIGSDESEYDEQQLLKFVNHKDVGLLKAHNPSELVKYIRWASTTATVGASAGKSKDGGATIGNVVLPPPPTVTPTPGQVF